MASETAPTAAVDKDQTVTAASPALLRPRCPQRSRERWAFHGSQLVEAGRHAEAFDALERAYRSGTRGWSDAILTADAVRGARLLEGTARKENDDEALERYR